MCKSPLQPLTFFRMRTKIMRKIFILMLIVILVVAAILLEGCTLIPKYARPEAPVPPVRPEGPARKETTRVAQGAPAVADLKSRGFFSDKQIQTIIQAALENNNDLQITR